ncbi:LuxR C-terminal-related transcriptional regulator, partial [Escherichia coli]
QNDVTLKMPAFEWVHVQLHQQKGMISLSPPTICNSAEILRWTAEGKTSAEIAMILSISENTVNFHQKNMQKKINAPNKTQVACYAAATGLI